MLLQSITRVTQLYTAAAAALGFLFVIGLKIIIHRGEKKKTKQLGRYNYYYIPFNSKRMSTEI